MKRASGKFTKDIKKLIRKLSGPDYITDFYSEIGVKSLIILRNVFRADESYFATYLAKFLFSNSYVYKGKKVLDLGCGCGILGLVCSLNGAERVYFSDINPVAIKNSRLNSILLDVGGVDFSCGSLFENIPKKSKFDVIIFNSPTTSGVPRNITETSFVRKDSLMTEFYATFPKFLSKNGVVIVPFSTRFDENTSATNLAKKYQYRIKALDVNKEDNDNYKSILQIRTNLKV